MSDRAETAATLPTEIREIAILRALVLGDLLCAVPMFRSIRHRFPGAGITLIGLPWARSFVERFNGYLDDFVEFPGFPGIKERNVEPARIVGAIGELQRRQFDLAIQAHGSGLTSNTFTALIGARTTAGWPRWCTSGRLCTRRSGPASWRWFGPHRGQATERRGDAPAPAPRLEH